MLHTMVETTYSTIVDTAVQWLAGKVPLETVVRCEKGTRKAYVLVDVRRCSA